MDSQLYLEQLLKLSSSDTGSTVRPLIVVLYLLSQLDYLSYDEFRYLMPLCTNKESTSYILMFIKDLRNGTGTIDTVIKNFLLLQSNYQKGLERFVNNEFSEALLLSVGMNRKSATYDKSYVPLYELMYAVYIKNDSSRIYEMFNSLKKFQSSIAIKWKQLMFDTSLTSQVKKEPISHLLPLPDNVTTSEKDFKEFFFLTMHLNKAKATLEDYLDLNRRYLGLTNCFIFEDNLVKLDIVPKQYFESAIDELYKQAYKKSNLLEVCCPISDICPALVFDKQKIINGLNEELGIHVETIEDAYNEVDKIRYSRFNKLVDLKFTDAKILKLLSDFEN